MSAAKMLLAELHKLGAIVSKKGDFLHIDAPAGAISSELLESLSRHRAELLSMVTEDNSVSFECGKGYKYAKFTIRGYSFVMEIPKDKYDGLAILELFEKYHGRTVH